MFELLATIPDEFYDWVKKIELKLHNDFAVIEKMATAEFKEFSTRKETAQYFQTCQYPAILFAMLDKRNYAPYIWKLIRPNFEKPFFNTNKEQL